MTVPDAGDWPGGAASAAAARLPSWLQSSSMTVLLVVLVTIVFVVPVVLEPGQARRLANDVSFTLILLAAAVAIFDARPLPLAAVALCGAAVAIRWLEWLFATGGSNVVREGTALAALVLLTPIVAARVFARGTVTADRVMGAVALYLLLGFAWASAYELVALHDPHAFGGGAAEGVGAERWIYFSFVTLTTAGYGDIVPVARSARSLAVLEALVGQLYPAIILARLVSLQGERLDRDRG
jgi:hypothetical protein